MFRVEKMQPKDFSFAAELANTMIWNMTAADFEFNAELEPNGCFILCHNQERVGLATCISYGKIGWFGNLIVKDTYRKQGAGTQLVQHAVSYLRSVGVTTVGLYAYPHLVDFYGRLVFKRDADFVVLKADAVSSLPGNQDNLKARELQNTSGIVGFDSGCFGASRKKLLGLILRDKRNLCYVAAEGSKVDGYVAAKVYGKMAEVGPLICRRSHPDKAVNLLKTVLGKLAGLEVYMCLPTAETALLQVAAKAGFKEEFFVARMFLGSLVAKGCIYVAESLERG